MARVDLEIKREKKWEEDKEQEKQQGRKKYSFVYCKNSEYSFGKTFERQRKDLILKQLILAYFFYSSALKLFS